MKSKLIRSMLTIMTVSTLLSATPVTSQAGKIYVFESDGNGFNTKTVFYDDGKEVVAFDAQFTESFADQAIKFLQTKTSSPIKYLVVTHPNPDKFNGAPAFQRLGAKVVMSKETQKNLDPVHQYKKYYFVNMAKMFTDSTYPKLASADITFDDNHTITLKSGEKVELKELHQPGVSTNQTVAFIPAANALVVGDLVHHKVHAWLEGPIVESKASFHADNWIAALNKVKTSYNPNVQVYGGRGDSGSLGMVIDEQIAYLQKARKIVWDYVTSLQGATAEDKQKKADYKELTTRFEKSFPDYKHSYMINYGSYGIVATVK